MRVYSCNTHKIALWKWGVFFFYLVALASEILVPWLGIKPMPAAVEAQSANPWWPGQSPTQDIQVRYLESKLLEGRDGSCSPMSMVHQYICADPAWKPSWQVSFWSCICLTGVILFAENWNLQYPLWFDIYAVLVLWQCFKITCCFSTLETKLPPALFFWQVKSWNKRWKVSLQGLITVKS